MYYDPVFAISKILSEPSITLNESFQKYPSQRQLPSVDNMENAVTHSSTTKRVFHLKEHTLKPYQFPVKGMPRPNDLTNIEYKDIFWMMSIAL